METGQLLRPNQGERRSRIAYPHSSRYQSQRTERREFSQVKKDFLVVSISVCKISYHPGDAKSMNRLVTCQLPQPFPN